MHTGIIMEIKKINKSYINFEYFVTFSLSNGILTCQCSNSVNDIPGKNNWKCYIGNYGTIK